MSRLPDAERARAHRDALAVHAFVTSGVLPLLTAAAASTSPDGLSADRIAAITALRTHPTTRAALDGAVLDIQRVYEQGKVAWEAGREREAAAHFERARRASVQLVATMRRTVPAAVRVLQEFVANLGSAIADGFAFGGGLGIALLVGVAFLALKGK